MPNVKVTLTKENWLIAGQHAGWLKQSMRNVKNVIIDFDTFDFIEDNRDVDKSSNNTWDVSYNASTLDDSELLLSLSNIYGYNTIKFLVQLFKAGNFSATNVNNGNRIGAEELSKMAFVDQELFWYAIKQGGELQDQEDRMEQAEEGRFDDQQPSHSDIHGPDLEKPQY